MTLANTYYARFLRLFIVVLLDLSMICSQRISLAGPEPSIPTQVEAWFAQGTEFQDTLTIDRQVLFGAIAFNSPYLYGGAALKDLVTCVACHGSHGPSGPVRHVSFDKPIPDLLQRNWEQDTRAPLMPEAFIRSSIVHEFSGPPPSENLVHAMGAYLRQINSSRNATHLQRLTDEMLAGVSILVLRYDINHGHFEDIDFLIESARFVLGEAAKDDDARSQFQLSRLNRELKELGNRFSPVPNKMDLPEIDRLLASIQKELLRDFRLTIKDS